MSNTKITAGTIRRIATEILKKSGYDAKKIRLGKDAIEELAKYTENELIAILKRAAESAKSAGKATITATDIRLVTRQID